MTASAPDVARALHDLRNALGAVSMNLEIAADPSIPPAVARAATDDALSTVRDLEERVEAFHLLLRRGIPPFTEKPE